MLSVCCKQGMSFDSCHVAEKLEAAMKAMVVTVAKHLEKAQQSLAARIADTFTILWYTIWSNSSQYLASSISMQLLVFAYASCNINFHLSGCIATLMQPAKALPMSAAFDNLVTMQHCMAISLRYIHCQDNTCYIEVL